MRFHRQQYLSPVGTLRGRPESHLVACARPLAVTAASKDRSSQGDGYAAGFSASIFSRSHSRISTRLSSLIAFSFPDLIRRVIVMHESPVASAASRIDMVMRLVVTA